MKLNLVVSAVIVYVASYGAFKLQAAHADAFAAVGTCQEEAYGTPSGFFQALYTGEIISTSANSGVWIVCGLGRLTTSSPRTVYIDYEDHSTVDDVYCGVEVFWWGGGGGEWGSGQESSYSGQGVSSFKYTIPSGTVGYVAAECYIPAYDWNGGQSGIFGINIQ